MVEDSQNRLAVATVLANRLFYSINWFSIPPIFFLIALDLNQPLSGLGLISSAFLVGIGLFQVPGAILSSRFGPRRMCITGMVMLSLSTLLCGAVSDIYLLAILRFFSGMGMALFFSPSIALMTSHTRTGSAGFVLGLNNAVASLGGGIGLFGWALIGDSFGWRFSLALIGALGLASTVFLFTSVPRDPPPHSLSLSLPGLRRMLLDRWLLVVGAVMLAYSIGNTLVSTFAEVYMRDQLGVSAGVAGALGSMVILGGLFTAPIAGHFHDRVSRVRAVIVGSGLAIALGVALPSLGTAAAVAASAAIVGLASGVGYTFAFAAAWGTTSLKAQSTIAMSWVNSVQLLFSFWCPYLFSYVVLGYGYQLAWLTGALYTAVFIFPILLPRQRPASRAAPW